MKVVITGFAYSRQNFFDVFKSYPKKEDLIFILPSKWKVKNSIVFKTPSAEGIKVYRSWTPFYNSNLPILGGLLKGWMPFLPWHLLKARFQGSKMLYSASEPNLLTTIINAFWARLFGMQHMFFTWENISYEKKFKGLRLFIGKLLVKVSIFFSSAAICGNEKAVEIIKSCSRSIIIRKMPPHGLDPDLFYPLSVEIIKNVRSQYGYVESDFIFLFVGALGYRKGIHLAIEAFKKISSENKNARFLIVGTGEYEPALKKLSKDLNLSSGVQFIPWLSTDKLANLYGCADVFLYPSFSYRGWEEQFGYSIAEASLCGLPVISTKTGSVDEVIQNGRTGYMVEPGSVSALTDVMEKIIKDPMVRKTLGRSGRDYIVGNFSNKIIADKLYQFFKLIYAE